MTRPSRTASRRRSLLACAGARSPPPRAVRRASRADRRPPSARRRRRRPRPSAVGRPPSLAVRVAAPLGTVRLALDWTPNTNHTGFYVAAAKGWYDEAGVDLQILPYGSDDPRGADRRRPGRVRDQLPGRADLRRRGRRADRLGHGDPPAHGPGDRGPRRRPTITRPRDLDGKTYAGFGYPNEEPTLKVGHQGRRRHGHVQDRDPRHRRLRRALREARRLRDHVRRLGGDRGQGARHRRCGRSSSATTASRTSTRSSSPATAAGWRRTRTSRAHSSAATVRGFELAADDPDDGRGAAGRPEPGRLRRQPDAARSTARSSSPRAATCATTSGAVGRQTLAKWQGYSGFLFDQGLLAGPDGKPLDHARPTTGRCSRTTSCRDDRARPARALGAADRSSSRSLVLAWEAYVRLAGARPDHAAGAVARARRAVGLPRGRRRPPRPDAGRGDRRLRRVGGRSPSRRPSRSIAGSRSAAPSSRCS